MLLLWPVIAGYESTSQLGSGADQLKIIWGNLKCPQALRFPAFGQVETRRKNRRRPFR